MIAADDVLRGVDQFARIVEKVFAGGGGLIVEERIIRIVLRFVVVARQPAGGIDDVEVAHLALDRERCLRPRIARLVGKPLVSIKISGRGVVGERTGPRGNDLSHEARRDGPVVADVDFERAAAALRVDIVGIVLHERRIGERDPGGWENHRLRYDVDEAGLMLVPADEANGSNRAQGNVDEALDRATHAAMVDVVGFKIVARREMRRVGLVGDDADGACFGARAVERALGSGERFHARDIVDVNVEYAVDRRDWLLVEVDAHRRQRAGMVLKHARGNAAHVHVLETRASRGIGKEGHARQILYVVVEILNVQLFEFRRAEGLDADRHVLQVFRALLRGDDHFFQTGIFRAVLLRLLLRVRGLQARK